MANDLGFCKNCKFWNKLLKTKGLGTCHRYPATGYKVVTTEWPCEQWMAPIVEKDFFCGEWQVEDGAFTKP